MGINNDLKNAMSDPRQPLNNTTSTWWQWGGGANASIVQITQTTAYQSLTFSLINPVVWV